MKMCVLLVLFLDNNTQFLYNDSEIYTSQEAYMKRLSALFLSVLLLLCLYVPVGAEQETDPEKNPNTPVDTAVAVIMIGAVVAIGAAVAYFARRKKSES